jgi:predicted GIY-YIG superfamily endonuclease
LNKVLYESVYPGKLSRDLKNRAGIYKLEFDDGSFYVGQSVNLYERLNEHTNRLKNKKHGNYKLQRKYLKHRTLKIKVLFFLEDRLNNFDTFTKSLLLTRLEQIFFNLLEPDLQLTYELSYFYNVWEANKNKVIDYKFISPTGCLFYGYNLNHFAKSLNLDDGALKRVANGVSTHHLGWTSTLENHLLYKQGLLVTPECERSFYLISPEGIEFTGSNVKKFCEENNLSRRNILRVVVGERCHHLGWTNSFKNYKKVTRKVKVSHANFGYVECFLYNIASSIKEKFNIKVPGHIFMRKNIITLQGWKISYLD